MNDDPKYLVKLYEALKTTPERTNLENNARDIVEFIRPTGGDFQGEQDKGRKPTTRRYDETAINACLNFQRGMYSLGTSKANRWFDLKTSTGIEAEYLPAKQYLEVTRDLLSGLIGDPRSQFYRHLQPLYGDLGSFGTSALFSQEAAPGALVFKSVSLANLVMDVDAFGVVDTVIERYTLSAQAAHRRFNKDGVRCTDANKWHEKEPFRRIEFLHAVRLNEHIKPNAKLSPESKPFIGCHITRDGRELCEKRGFNEFPYQVPRWTQEPGAVYGRGMGLDSLATTMGLNAMKRSNLRAGQNIAEPPILVASESVFGGKIRAHPGDYIYGGIDQMTGRPLVGPMQTGANLPVMQQLFEMERLEVRDVWFFDFFKMAQRANMTATEVLARQEENLRMLGPHLGLLETDLLEPVLRRVAGFAERNGWLPPIPEEMGQIEIEFVSPLAKAQKAADAVAIQRSTAFAMSLAQGNPDAMLKIDVNKAIEMANDALGAPSAILISDEEVQVMKAQQQQAQQMQMAMGALQQGAQAAESFANAEAANAA